ncbi:MAG: LPS assembly lipoprotein LptE [Betaproteobacteria bacterium]|nr:LPS assembly lipoprotein LptE [Betaproteobacteria bacterium]
MKRPLLFSSTLAMLAGVLLLSACGFTLRGTGGDFRLPFKTLYINISGNDAFAATLRRHIRSTGTEIVQDRKQADASLEILRRDRTREVLSLSTAGRVREYALFYTFRFQVTDRENRILMEPVEIRLRRTLIYDESQAYAREKEAEMLYEDMQNDVISQVVRRMANIEINDQSDKTEPDL